MTLPSCAMQLLEIAQVPDEHVSYFLFFPPVFILILIFLLCYFNFILEATCSKNFLKKKKKILIST